MFISPVSFSSNFKFRTGDSSGITEEQMSNEINSAKIARDYGVSVPKYSISKSSNPNSGICVEYQTKGEIANYKSNKITSKHLKNLFKHLYTLDTQNLSHNDLDIGHVFYSEDGDVEFDCFRFSSPFIVNKKKQYSLPDFMFQTNQINYENAGLCFYVKQIPTEKEKLDFVKTYLKASSSYHQNRADYIKNNSAIFPNEMYNYEALKANILKHPDNKTADLMLSKLDFLEKQRTAFTEWDEGNGACGHAFSKERRLNSIPMYLNAIKSAVDYSKKADLLSLTTTGKKSEYYKYEAKVGEFFANTYASWVQGMADYNFRDSRVITLPDEEREELNEQYNKIINADILLKKYYIDKYTEAYHSKL